MKKIWCVVAFLALTACKSLGLFEEPQCYWKENYSGKYKWITSQEAIGESYSKSSCYAADSCSGGLGQSGGGCYKWSVGADGDAISWDN
ncbi:MAG: hypothetical protein ISQ34_02870 [Rickettsiales bacterium]|nr:hypothetical protein [Rickettsiales bacterium]